jgi:hypothetical protein
MYYSGKKIQEILNSGEAKSLDSLSDLEDVVTKLNELDKKTNFLEELKRNRSQSIDEEIKKVNSTKDFLRKVVSKTLESCNEESITFPGVGTVSQSKPRSTWVIKDEQEFLKILKENVPEDKIQDFVTTKEVVNKRKIDDLLDKLEGTESFPEGLVEKQTGEDSIKIRFNKDLKSQDKDNGRNDESGDINEN